ncbi:hypothetical protein CEXT_160971 [Caerostris extrusa]|uniref:Uncharacterized protein n=1 Tax=Caerostris extrusa TaxID=172846 RepID=A0AAV4WBX2_CAEEX|nr:hypothetical protein CEXT_160971 [Caerostris extrusa]
MKAEKSKLFPSETKKTRSLGRKLEKKKSLSLLIGRRERIAAPSGGLRCHVIVLDSKQMNRCQKASGWTSTFGKFQLDVLLILGVANSPTGKMRPTSRRSGGILDPSLGSDY